MSGCCPICGNQFGYGISIDGICEECYINQQIPPEPKVEEWEYSFNSKEEYEKYWEEEYEKYRQECFENRGNTK